jgi:Na+:H+ antiporter, NhaA family
MELMIPPGRLDRPVDHETDHVLGPSDAEITLVEYGSYACPHCRAANERIAQARHQLGDRVCYAFRHRPLLDNSLAFRAELAELAQTPEAFWSAHIKLMTRSMQLTEDDLVAVATDLGVNADFALSDSDAVRRARARVEADIASSRASGVRFTLTSRPPRSPCSPRRFFRPSSGLLCSGELRARSLSKRRRKAAACKYRSPLAFMRGHEQEVFG